MACDFPRCECMCHPDNCVFLEKNKKKGKRMNDQVVQEPVAKVDPFAIPPELKREKHAEAEAQAKAEKAEAPSA